MEIVEKTHRWSETTSPVPSAGLNGGEGPWQRGEWTSILYVWVGDAQPRLTGRVILASRQVLPAHGNGLTSLLW